LTTDPADPTFLSLVESFGQHEAELVEVARRLPTIAGEPLAELTLSQVSPGLRAAFASYGADHGRGHVVAAQDAWDKFWAYLIAADLASDSPMGTISRIRTGWARIWEWARAFSNSTFFKSTLVGALLTLIIFGFEEHSKLALSVRQTQADRHRATRLTTVTKTKDLIDSISATTSELMYFPDAAPPTPASLDDLRRRLRNQLTTAEALFAAWRRDLPLLTTDDVDNFIEILNAEVEATDSVAYYLTLPSMPGETAALREELDVVEQGSRSIMTTAGLRMLDCVIDVADSTEKHPCGLNQKAAKDDIAQNREWLRTMANDLRLQKVAFLSPLPEIDSPDATEFRTTLRAYALAQAHPPNVNYDEQFRKLETLLRQLPRPDRLLAAVVPYTKDYLARLADWFQLNQFLEARAPRCDTRFGPREADSQRLCVGSKVGTSRD
jgi:hypothetical protein